jgi:hypothetical protein
MMLDTSLYYNPNKLLSYDRILNFVIGARGIGKTYGFKKHCIKRFIKHGEQFIYLKRYKTDIKGSEQFFDAVSKEFPEHTFKVKGRELYIDDKLCGWIMPLSAWQSVKSREFPDVATILYDEFLLESSSKQSYMQDEPKALLNFMDTVFRNRTNVRCICMSNAVSVVNPFFLYFDIIPNIDRRYNAFKSVVVEIPDSVDFRDERKKTKFGELISETDYGAFSLGNEFINDSKVFIEKRTKDSKFIFSVIYKGMTIGVWVDVNEGLMFMSHDHDPSTKKIYAMSTDDLDENTLLMSSWKQNYHLKKLAGAFMNGYLRFDNQVLRNIGYEMFKKMGVQ